MIEGTEMLFEETIRSFLGDDAFHIAGQAHPEINRKIWFRKITKKIIRQIQKIESNSTHRLAHCSEDCLTALRHPYSEIKFTLCILRLLYVLLVYKHNKVSYSPRSMLLILLSGFFNRAVKVSYFPLKLAATA